MVQKSYSGVTRAEAIRRIFTEGVSEYAKESGLPMGEALTGLIQENRSLWTEYCADAVPVQGVQLPGDASARLASEMNAYAKENRCSLAVALCEVAKAKPSLFQKYLKEIPTIV
jgi:hypothetical protein